MATNAINFFRPGTDAAVEQQQIDRQRKMAELLMQKSQTPAQGQMVSGHYIAPSWISGVTQALQGVGANLANQRADEKQIAMGQALRAKNAEEVKGFMGALSGTPAQQIQPLTPNDDEGNPMPVAQKDAVAPDRNRALALAMQSQNPMLQNYGGKLIDQQMAEEAMKADMAAAGISAPGAAPGGPVAMGAGGAGPAAGGAPAGAPGTAPAGAPGGALAGMDPRAVGLMLSRSPQLNKLGSTMLEQGKPIALREGDLVVPDGQGGFRSAYTQPKLEAGMQPVRAPGGGLLGASAIPGYAQGIGQIQGAKAQATQGAESENTMVTVDTPNGPKMMTRAQALQMANGGQPQPPQQPMPPARGANFNGPGYAGGSAAAAAMGQAEILTSELGKAQQAAALAQQQGDTAGAARAQSDVAGIQRELGRLPGARAAQASMPAPMPAGPGIALQDDASKKFGQSIATQSAEALTAGRDKAKTAADDLLSVQQARSSIKAGAFQGSGAETKLAIAKFINGNIPGINIDPEKVGNTDYLKSTLGSGVLAQAKALGANPSNADAERINQIVGDIGKDPMAMNKILDWREEMNKRAIENHNRTVDDAEKRGMKSPFDLRVKPGPAPAASGFKIIGVQ